MGSERARKSQEGQKVPDRRGQRAEKARECQKRREKAKKSQKGPERAKFHPIFLRIFFETRVFFPLRFFKKGEEGKCQKEH